MNTDNPAGAKTRPASKHRLISRVLSPAIQLWLRSQVQQVSHLEVKISGSDRQILTGYIPSLSISASKVVYQGLHLSQLHLVGEGVRINLGSVLKGQPLQLEPLPVSGKLLWQETDLNASLQSSMLIDGLTEFLVTLLQSSSSSDPFTLSILDRQFSWQNPQIKINDERVIIRATLVPITGNPMPILISTGFQLVSSHVELNNPEVQIPLGSPLLGLNDFKLDLGSEVVIEELTLIPEQLICCGQINVIPAS